MAESYCYFAWSMPSCEMALQINMNRKKGSQAITPDELNPFAKRKKITGKKAWDLLRKMYKKE